MARSFNGSSDKIVGPTTSTGWTQGVPWSASAWIYPTSLPATSAFFAIFSKRSGGQTFFEIFLENVSGTTGFGAYTGGSFTTFGNFSTNTWYHVLATCDGTNFIAYINGVASGTFSANMLSGSGTLSTIGIGIENGADFFAGRIADCAYWSNAKLTAGEAAALGNGARPYQIRPGSLLVYYPLDGLQSPEPDIGSGLAYNGTLTGTSLAFGPPMMQFTPRWPLNSPIAIAAAQTFQPAWATQTRIVVDGIGI